MAVVVGLDVGGAHLKVARTDAGRLVAVAQFLCPLWQGLDRLDAALAAATPLTEGAGRVAVTMTGELSDLFESRAAGVEAIVRRVVSAHGPATAFWMGARGFGAADAAVACHADTGSANFLATAAWIGLEPRCADALLIDFGSTTVDIVPIAAGRPAPRGLTDAERQATGELVYTGLTRTAVMGVADRAPVEGRWVTLAREYLATMADVRRVLGDDLDGIDLHATADGKGRSRAEAETRLARMLGRDRTTLPPEALAAAATWIREQQRRSIMDGVMLVASASPLPPGAPVVAAGIGASEVERLARELDRTCLPFGALAGASDAVRRDATHHAPAVAVALLAARASSV